MAGYGLTLKYLSTLLLSVIVLVQIALARYAFSLACPVRITYTQWIRVEKKEIRIIRIMSMRLYGIIFALGAVAVPSAFADAVTCSGFSSGFTLGATSGGNVTGDFANLCVTLSGTTATFTFTASNGFGLVDTGIADVNLKTTTFTEVGTPSETPSGTINFNGSNNVGTFGSFSETLKDQSAATSRSQVVFQLSSADFTNVNTILAANSQGFDAAVHVRCDSCSIPGQTGLTFFAGESVSSVPEPSTYAFLGAALLAMVFFIRRKRAVQ